MGKTENRFRLLYLVGLIALIVALGTHLATAQSSKPLIDLNTASQKDLESLKGIGPAAAKKIIEGRPYKSVEDLKRVGLSEKTIESLKPLVKVGGPSLGASSSPEVKTAAPSPAPKTSPESKTPATPTAEKSKPKTGVATPAKLAPGQKVNLNTASQEQLEALPEIGPAKAKAIIAGRPYKTPEDVMKVKGIKQGTYNKIKDFITVQ